ncbi:MAG: Na/Pi cotransporter family protein [Spirochaetaceae bacterium]|jgi:phosphate:Na+ symporter|nr:Na/Pi cotransporter family protein [Spirochaetaceae bacterium]
MLFTLIKHLWDFVTLVGGPVLYLLGSLAMFLFGMKLMSEALHRASSEKLEKILYHMTSNRFTALLTGFMITAVIQSSSATTVMTVGFVNAGLMTLRQSIGVIMGANIGTTITGWIVSLLGFKVSMSALALPLMGIGLPLFFSKNGNRKTWGEFIFGFGILFLGLAEMKHAFDFDVSVDSISFLAPMVGKGLFSTLLFLLAGIVLTLILHSSSASMAITLTMAFGKLIPFEAAAAMILGGNIGTTVDAFLAGLGANTNAKRASYIHILFNVAGTIIVVILFRPFTTLVQYIIPGNDVTSVTTELAAFHTLFNLFNTILFIGFVPHMERLIKKLVKDEPEDARRGKYKLEMIEAPLQNTGEFNIMQAEREIRNMTHLTLDMFKNYRSFLNAPTTPVAKLLDKVKDDEDYSDQMEEELTNFLIQTSMVTYDETHQRRISSLLRMTNELESLCDNIYNLMLLADRKQKKELDFQDEDCQKMIPYSDVIKEFLEYILKLEKQRTGHGNIEDAYILEEKIDSLNKKMSKKSRKSISGKSSVKSELLYLDMLRFMEQMGDYCLNIAEAIKEGY